jgi:hypothetical protein
MRHGLILMAQRIAEQVELARAAERRGFDSVWTTEFFNQNGLVRLAAVAAATTRARVGTAISYAFMRSPVLSAAAALDIDELSGGRMVLGLGSGTRSMNESWYSMPFDAPRPAHARGDRADPQRLRSAARRRAALRAHGRRPARAGARESRRDRRDLWAGVSPLARRAASATIEPRARRFAA